MWLGPEGIAAIAFVVSLLLLLWQIVELRRSVQGQTYQAVYGQMFEIHRTFLERPELRPFFYDNVEADPANALAPQVAVMAEWIGDLFDNVFRQQATMPSGTFDEWRRYMRSVYWTSPALRQQLQSRAAWYPEDFVSQISDPAGKAG
jgi:hypothetical protein